ncbi:MBL fold metallo-hydrolase [Halomonas sp. THAF12]|uniref:MBL fold metallo-hydrolase n=1 Tax=Halomonas sp. B23F22_10 TaxID=3459515 RepID=UPI00373F76E2
MSARSIAISAVMLGTISVSSALVASPSMAFDPPGIVHQGADFYALKVGDVRVMSLTDGTVPQDLHELLRGTTNEKTDALLAQAYRTNPVEVSINVFLFELADRLVLVDTGSGDLFGPGYGGKLLDSLRAAGFQPEKITDILITHVHADHSGGLTRHGQIVFPNATVHVGEPDVEFFLDRENAARSGYDIKYFDEAITTLKPYVDAGRVDTFGQETEVLPGLTASLHPGHTPGSAFYTLESRGQTLTFIGDMVHVAPVQFPDPSITIVYDVDPEMAAEARATQFSSLAQQHDLVAAPHLPFPGVGHIQALEQGYRWVPVGYNNRDTTQAP